MILKNIVTGEFFHAEWLNLNRWGPAISYDDRNKILVKRATKHTFVDDAGGEYVRSNMNEGNDI